MSQRQDLRQITTLAQLVLDHRLTGLRLAAAELARSKAQLRAINASTAPVDLAPIAAGVVEVSYQRWADIRRAELNATIARQTAAWIDARTEAGTAFGRVQALHAIATGMEGKRQLS
ncbi:MAG: hypothetical protein C0524_11130 [Rhodobacter sp.]|nr:hypothetical protein [Rhodobacter sp.]